MSDGHRAFCMGNALVTGIPHEIGRGAGQVAGALTDSSVAAKRPTFAFCCRPDE